MNGTPTVKADKQRKQVHACSKIIYAHLVKKTHNKVSKHWRNYFVWNQVRKISILRTETRQNRYKSLTNFTDRLINGKFLVCCLDFNEVPRFKYFTFDRLRNDTECEVPEAEVITIYTKKNPKRSVIWKNTIFLKHKVVGRCSSFQEMMHYILSLLLNGN